MHHHGKATLHETFPRRHFFVAREILLPSAAWVGQIGRVMSKASWSWMLPTGLGLVVFGVLARGSEESREPAADSGDFERLVLTREFWSEGANFGDFNGDGAADLVAGPFWWAGPDFEKRHAYAPTEREGRGGKAPHRAKNPEGEMVSVAGFAGAWSGQNAYADCFQVWAGDFNGNGRDDILKVSFPGEAAVWYENPGTSEGDWPRHVAVPRIDNESPAFTDLTGDGVPELVYHRPMKGGARVGYAEPDAEDPTAPWRFRPISAPGKWGVYQHGLGTGDVNGDGRADVLMNHGWWEQPESLEGDPEWTFHAADFAPQAAQIHVEDVNGDGRADVVTALEAHGHGLAWHEQMEDGSFRRHGIMGSAPEESAGGVVFTQPHAVELADVDGDGRRDIVTGKRFWAHGPTGDVDPNGTPVLYAYLPRRDAAGSVSWEPRLLDEDSGVGVQFVARDIDADGSPELAIANKRGVFLFRGAK